MPNFIVHVHHIMSSSFQISSLTWLNIWSSFFSTHLFWHGALEVFIILCSEESCQGLNSSAWLLLWKWPLASLFCNNQAIQLYINTLVVCMFFDIWLLEKGLRELLPSSFGLFDAFSYSVYAQDDPYLLALVASGYQKKNDGFVQLEAGYGVRFHD